MASASSSSAHLADFLDEGMERQAWTRKGQGADICISGVDDGLITSRETWPTVRRFLRCGG